MMRKTLLVVVAVVVSVGAVPLLSQGSPQTQSQQGQPQLQPVPKAQEPQKKDKDKDQDRPFVVRVPINEVALPVTFLDPGGDFVTDIERPEVTILDNKMTQKMQNFE